MASVLTCTDNLVLAVHRSLRLFFPLLTEVGGRVKVICIIKESFSMLEIMVIWDKGDS